MTLAPSRSRSAAADPGRHPSEHDRGSSRRTRGRQRRRGPDLRRVQSEPARWPRRSASRGSVRGTASASADQLGDRRAVRRDRGHPARGRRLRAGRRRRPRRARPRRSSTRPTSRAVIGEAVSRTTRRRRAGHRSRRELPTPADDAWIIFTSGSTGTPKGVAVTPPLGGGFRRRGGPAVPAGPRRSAPGDRVMAGLSVAFDASCEEMWLAWRYGACLVPAPRSLVRSGMDLGPWLVANDITVVSTVPTLVSLWPVGGAGAGAPAHPRRGGVSARDRHPARHRGPRGVEHLRADRGHRGRVRRAAQPGTRRCGSGSRSTAGTWRWSTPPATRSRPGESGELIIGGIGPGALPRPGQGRREVRADARPGLGPGLPQRRPGPVRRARASCSSAAPTTRSRSAGGASSSARSTTPCSPCPGSPVPRRRCAPPRRRQQLLVGYVAVDDTFDPSRRWRGCARSMPAAHGAAAGAASTTLPTKTSGKIDRDALPVATARRSPGRVRPGLEGTAAWLQELWGDILGAGVGSRRRDDFFDLGGGSLTAAQLVSRLRERVPRGRPWPTSTSTRRVAGLAAALDAMAAPSSRTNRRSARSRSRPRSARSPSRSRCAPSPGCAG